jgi:hypothetical protein
VVVVVVVREAVGWWMVVVGGFWLGEVFVCVYVGGLVRIDRHRAMCVYEICVSVQTRVGCVPLLIMSVLGETRTENDEGQPVMLGAGRDKEVLCANEIIEAKTLGSRGYGVRDRGIWPGTHAECGLGSPWRFQNNASQRSISKAKVLGRGSRLGMARHKELPSHPSADGCLQTHSDSCTVLSTSRYCGKGRHGQDREAQRLSQFVSSMPCISKSKRYLRSRQRRTS